MTKYKQIIPDNILQKLDLDTIRKIQAIAAGGSLTSLFTTEGLLLCTQDDLIPTSVPKLLAAFCICASTFLSLSTVAISNKKKVLEYYKTFLENYQKLNTIFNLEDPVEIFVLYYYLYSEGYLSINKRYSYSNEADFVGPCGSRVLTGKGVCRNIADLLTDIYNKTGAITATNISVFYSCGEKKIERNHLIANHAITGATYKGKNYFFDPTNYLFLTKDPNNRNRFIDDEGDKHIISLGDILSINKRKVLKDLTSKSSYEYSEKDLDTLIRISKLCHDNKDIFEKFYSENKEIYEEVTRFYQRKK